jgi:aminoglycoside phosphotransferase (APT) family kinase protein
LPLVPAGSSTPVDGLDLAAVGRWVEANVDGAVGPFEAALIGGGRSNLTYAISSAEGRRLVVRRPPLSHVLATAHDVAREFRIISALGPTPVPVPPALALCTDEAVNGVPFYVMGFVDGVVLDSPAKADQLEPASRRRASEVLIDTLADLHDVSIDAVGLGDLAKREGYIERQLRRWYGQWQSSKTRDLEVVDEVHDALATRVPEQGAATIVHGDYRLDNCLLEPDGTIAAVLDWELCTLGDPLADVGLLLVYWTEPGDGHPALLNAPTLAEGFVTRAELMDMYAAASGRDVSHVDYYVAFGYWKLACILEGVFARYRGGAMGNAAGFEGFAQQVEFLAEAARAALGRLD